MKILRPILRQVLGFETVSQSFFDLYSLDTFEDHKPVISRMSLNVGLSEVPHSEAQGMRSDQDTLERTLCVSLRAPRQMEPGCGSPSLEVMAWPFDQGRFLPGAPWRCFVPLHNQWEVCGEMLWISVNTPFLIRLPIYVHVYMHIRVCICVHTHIYVCVCI